MGSTGVVGSSCVHLVDGFFDLEGSASATFRHSCTADFTITGLRDCPGLEHGGGIELGYSFRNPQLSVGPLRLNLRIGSGHADHQHQTQSSGLVHDA